MERLIRWFVNNSVAANLMMAFIIIAGALTVPLLRMEVFPEISVDIVNVTAVYPGASPIDVENAICIKIEERLQGLEGVKRITSSASENVGSVNLELIPGQDVNEMLDKIKAQIDAIDSFPENVERPICRQFAGSNPVVTVAIDGDMGESELSDLTAEIKDEIDGLPEITYTQFVARKDKEISLEISENTLRKYNLSFYQVSQAVQNWSVNIPSGSIKTNDGEILIRSNSQGYEIDDFSQIPIITDDRGSIVYLGDICDIKDGFIDSDELDILFNGSSANLLTVFRVGNQNAIDVSESVKKYVKEKNQKLPANISVTAWDDEAFLLRGRIDTMTKNAGYGLLLVIIVLALFLKPKLAFWVSLGIPISFMGGFLFMPLMDLSINMLSLFTFILVLGIVVDDAIVVGENVALFRERGLEPKEAAVQATKQVATPVFFAILTTMVTFSPMLSVDGEIGEIWRIFPLITIMVLFWSLFESLTILPAHLAHSKDKEPKSAFIRLLSEKWESLQTTLIFGLSYTIINFYKPFLKKSIDRPFTSLSIAAGIFILTIGIIAGGVVKFTFFPAVEADLAIGAIEYPSGTPIDVTRQGYLELERTASILEKDLNKELNGEVTIKNRLSTIGWQPMRSKTSRGPGNLNALYAGPNVAEVALELVPGEDRLISTEEVVRRWRKLMPVIPGAKDVLFFSSLFSAGDPINIQLSSKYIEDLLTAKDELKAKLNQYPGVFDVKDNYNLGKEEINIELLPAAKNYGVTMMMVATQVRQAFYGLEVQSIQRGRDEIKVVVRYPEDDRKSISDLEKMMISTPSGFTIPVRQIARLEIGQGLASIQRKDRKRSINITADVDLSMTTGNEVIASITTSLLPQLLQKYSSLSYDFEGEQQEQADNLKSIGKNFILAMIVVYMLLAIPFKSYFQPLIIMSSIPFGLTGALLGHLLLGMNFSVLSLMGIVALTGVVVNDSLVMVDFINRYRREGYSIKDAVLEAGPRRFRPIFLTSLTTFVGLIPLILEKSTQAQFMIPMAVSLAFGVIFATGITLLLIPVSYLTIEKYILKTEQN
ncbi:MAG: acriflavin resistance protein [Candidatus Marinimicrobia bacterium]|nr:acriflavin resistance protein [Candidatus Neomarinimicrobiota bacterium]